MTAEAGPARAGSDPSVPARTSRLGRDEFARLYEEHWRLFWCAAMSVVGDRALAQDVVQQSAMIALERLDQFTPDTSFTAWMIAIVRNTALNEARKRARRRTGNADAGVLESAPRAATSAQMNTSDPVFDQHLLSALDTLDETVRTCLLMRVVADMPYRQIALALCIPEGTVASHVHRARAALRTELSSSRGPDAAPHWRAVS